MCQYPALQPFCITRHAHAGAGARRQRQLDALYLDTTYCDPMYDFPAQDAAVLAVVQVARQYARRRDVQLVFGCYTIGKERLFMEVASQLDEKVCVPCSCSHVSETASRRVRV